MMMVLLLPYDQVQCTKLIDNAHILEPKCKYISPKPSGSTWSQLFIEDDPVNLLALSKQNGLKCRVNSLSSVHWMYDVIISS